MGISYNGGSVSVHFCVQYPHRVENLQPRGNARKDGTLPVIVLSCFPRVFCDGIDDNNPSVYGWE